MAKTATSPSDAHIKFILAQNMFFVGTAPLDPRGHVNLSPKGLDTFRILGPTTGVETIAHLRENERIVIMFCAFQCLPNILRLHGHGRSVQPEDVEITSLQKHFPVFASPRSIVVAEISRVSDSRGYGVPLMRQEGERTQLQAWANNKNPEGLQSYRQDKNR